MKYMTLSVGVFLYPIIIIIIIIIGGKGRSQKAEYSAELVATTRRNIVIKLVFFQTQKPGLLPHALPS